MADRPVSQRPTELLTFTDKSQVFFGVDDLQAVPESVKMTVATLEANLTPPGFLDAQVVALPCTNVSGGAITQGQPISVTGWNVGNSNASVVLADADMSLRSHGFARAAISDGQQGEFVVTGYAQNSTVGATVNDDVWLGPLGTIVFSQPTTGVIQKLGEVHEVSATGQIYVSVQDPQPPPTFEDLGDIVGSPVIDASIREVVKFRLQAAAGFVSPTLTPPAEPRDFTMLVDQNGQNLSFANIPLQYGGMRPILANGSFKPIRIWWDGTSTWHVQAGWTWGAN